MRKINMKAAWMIVAMSFAFPWDTPANDQIPGTPQTKPILIRGAVVHTIDGDVIDGGEVLFDAGKIVAVGKDIADVPDDAVVIDASGGHVYPGLIESMTDLGLREILAVDVSVDRDELGGRNPNVRSWVAVNPDSELIPVARAGGVLIAHVAPTGSFVRGQTAVMMLDGWTARDMNLSAPNGLLVDWESIRPRDEDPVERAKKSEAELKQLDDWFDRATRYGEARRSGRIADVTDLALESLLPVLRGERPMFVEANSQTSIESAIAYAVSRELKVVIYGGYDAAACSALLKKYDVPVIIAATYRLPRRRDDAYDASYTLPERLRKAGVKFAISGEGPGYPGGSSNARNLPYHAGNAVAYGLPRDQAVRSITLSAAEILGVSDRIGSITPGKDATLLICDGDILETETNVTRAFVQGRVVDLSSKHTMLFEKYQKKYLGN